MRLKRCFADLLTPSKSRRARQRIDAQVLGLIERARERLAARQAALKLRDLERDLKPDWFQRLTWFDSFSISTASTARCAASSTSRLSSRTGVGLCALHAVPDAASGRFQRDGGYLVMDYRRINSAYGTMADLDAVDGGAT